MPNADRVPASRQRRARARGQRCRVALALGLLAAATRLAVAGPMDLADFPLVLFSSVRPNILIMLDNSGSMADSMTGTPLSPDDPATKGNIAHAVLLNLIDGYRTRFNWGLEDYVSPITGLGQIVEQVQTDSSPHYVRLATALAPETLNPLSTEIKSNTGGTPLAGSVVTAYDYFSGSIPTLPSPAQQTCQRNYLLLATDGLPNMRTDGTPYLPADTADAVTGQAYLDVYAQVARLRSVTSGGHNYDVKTYVIGMGDDVATPVSVQGLNTMAAAGGTGHAYLASDPSSLSLALQSIAADISSHTAASAAVAVNSGSWRSGASLYQGRFDSSNWSGQLLAYPVQADGTLGTASWDAATVLAGQDWDTGRQIITYKGSAAIGSRGIPFRWPANPASPTTTELDAAQSSLLQIGPAGTADGQGPARLQYLRGDMSQESGSCPTCTVLFRPRGGTPLGDLVNSAPSYVAGPEFGWRDSMESVAYSGFATTWRNRTPMVYVGANDGMLHAFNATSGREVFAYVPRAVYPDLSALSWTSYLHRFTVDGSPTIGDVFYSNAWHTLLVAGLNAGGQAVYALDVTNPANFTEATANTVARWEFGDSDDPDMGNVFGQPLLVKTNNGRWSVIVANGYNSTAVDGHASGTGHAVLFVLDAETGQVRAKIDTGVGTLATPNGLSAPVAVDTDGNGTADYIYAGDLSGRLWKFDLTSATAGSWTVALSGQPIFNTGGRPITARPDVGRLADGGFMVVFGTGRFVATTDPSDASAQGLYGIHDDGTTAVDVTDLEQQSVVTTATGTDTFTYRVTTHAVGAPTDATLTGDNVITRASYASGKKGWYLDLPTGGERVVSEASIRAGRVVFSTIIPNTAPCSWGGTGWIMELDLVTGNRLDQPTFDTNGDTMLTHADFVTTGSNQVNTTGRALSFMPSAPGFMQPPQTPGRAPYENKYLNASNGSITVLGETAGSGTMGRLLWQQIR